jgi:GTP cyclohydrolase I
LITKAITEAITETIAKTIAKSIAKAGINVLIVAYELSYNSK